MALACIFIFILVNFQSSAPSKLWPQGRTPLPTLSSVVFSVYSDMVQRFEALSTCVDLLLLNLAMLGVPVQRPYTLVFNAVFKRRAT